MVNHNAIYTTWLTLVSGVSRQIEYD